MLDFPQNYLYVATIIISLPFPLLVEVCVQVTHLLEIIDLLIKIVARFDFDYIEDFYKFN